MKTRTESPDLQNCHHTSNGYGTRAVEVLDEVWSRYDARHDSENSNEFQTLKKDAYAHP
jgi:hypothetical protein